VKDYGPLGGAYPVEPGQVWRAQGHLFLCGSMFNLEPPERPTLVYADPPWDQGLYKSFHTHAGLAAPSHDWTDLYRRIAELAAGAPCFIEGSHAQHETVASLLDGQGETYAAWPIESAFKRGCVLHYCGPTLPRHLPDLAGVPDYETPGLIMGAYPPGIVLDPCCGLGFTSRAAKRGGWHSINFELHPRRMSRAMAQLKIEPHQVVSEGTIP
jgi:hypothetical protein